MADNQYIYAVARIRTLELSLLDKSFIDQLLAGKSYEDCLRLLAEKGWGKSGNEKAEQLLSGEREKIWDVVGEMVPDMSVFDTFLYSNDFHNLKAAIKQVYMNEEFPNIFISRGTIDAELILRAVKEHDFSLLPDYMRDCAEEAYQVQFHTGDSQLCDLVIDKAALENIYKKGRADHIEILSEYAELQVASADINIAVRGCKTGKPLQFFERALADCASLDINRLTDAALNSLEEIYHYLENTDYTDAVSALKESGAAFEKWIDNRLMESIRPQKYNSFSLSPIAAYILARENEIKSVRIILSGKLNDLPEDSIRERLREMYV
jgi:V/A-type H+/Na+-transporting ATPase subunit C